MSGAGEEALAVLQDNLHWFENERLLPIVNKWARTSKRFQNIFASERNILAPRLAPMIREQGFENTFGKFWKSKMLVNKSLFNFIMHTFPEMQKSLALEFLQFSYWNWSLHAVVGVLQILIEHGYDPWIMFPGKIPAGIYKLECILKENSDKINAWCDAMDSYHGNWVTGARFDARTSFEPQLTDDKQSVWDGKKHTFLFYMVSQQHTNEVILDELERRYDLSTALNEQDPNCNKTPLIKALGTWYVTGAFLHVWLLRRTDIMHPNNNQAVFKLIGNAPMFENVDEDGDLVYALYETCSHYDWRTQNKQGLNAWQVCCVKLHDNPHQPLVLVQEIKRWLESLGAGPN